MRWTGTAATLILSSLWVRDALVFVRSAMALRAVARGTSGRGLGDNEGDSPCVIAARGERALATQGVSHLARLGRHANVVIPTEEIDEARAADESGAFLGAPHTSKRDLVEWYRRAHPDAGFWLFDSDSRPTAVPVPRDVARFQQMGSIYWSRDPVMSGLAFLQTCVSLGEELPRIDRGRCFYVVGHGLYIPPQPSQPFPDHLTEDVALGYLLSASGTAVNVTRPIDGCDFAQAPVDLRTHVRQARRWMAGDFAATKLLSWSCRLKRRLELRVTWTHRFVAVFALLAVSVATADTTVLVGLCAVWSLRFTCRILAIRSYLRVVPRQSGARSYARFGAGVCLKPALDAIAWVGVRRAFGSRAPSASWSPTIKDEAAHE